LGEQIVQTEETLHGNQEESRQEKETLSGPMLVENSPKASPEEHLLRGFSFVVVGRQSLVVGKPRMTREGLTTIDHRLTTDLGVPAVLLGVVARRGSC
jgi:hypothetical protein